MRAGNLFVQSLDNGDLEQMTDIRAAAAAGATPAAPAAGGGGRGGRGGGGGGGRGGGAAATDEPKATDSQEYLKKEQTDMFEIVRNREKLKAENDAKTKARTAAARKPYTLQARQTMGAMQLSPDNKYVIAVISEAATATKNSIVPNWITDSSFPEDLPGRTRVGDDTGATRHLALINVATGEVKMEIGRASCRERV